MSEEDWTGEYGNKYPWGDEWNPNYCNSSENGPGGTTSVGLYSSSGDSPYGVADMAGNIWELTYSLHKGYPYDPYDGREIEHKTGYRVLRGGSYNFHRRLVRCACRYHHPNQLFNDIGFRVILLPAEHP